MTEFCRFKKTAYIVLDVIDLKRSTDFYKDVIGLDLTLETEVEARLSCSRDFQNIVLRQGPVAGLSRISFEIESEADLERLKAQISGAGLTFSDVSPEQAKSLAFARGIRMKAPECDVELEFYTGPKLRTEDFTPTVADIIRFVHLVVKTPAFEAAYAFFTEVLKFDISDHTKSEDGGPHEVVFMRVPTNVLHHTFGLARANRTGLHHFAFMVRDINDIGRAMNRLPKAGAEIVFGPGRHLASGSIFLYFLDPDGMTVEYTLGMEEFSVDNPRAARKLPPLPETVDMWGGAPISPKYAAVGAIVPA